MGKKDFSKANATLDYFISQDSKQKVDGTPEEPAKKTKKPKKSEEVRSRRVQVVVTPTTYNGIYKIAKKEYLSVNEVINKALAEYIERSK